MSSHRTGAVPRTGIGLRAQKGGAVAVGVVVEAGEPCVTFSTLLATHVDGDRLALEPYRVAYDMAQGGGASADAAAAVAEGRRRQDALAADGLAALLRDLEQAGRSPVAAAMLVNRAGWVTDLLEYSLEWAEHVPVAEGLAVREALRFAFRQCGIEAAELDEKSLKDRAAETLGIAPEGIDARLKALGASAGKPWRKEQKLACLAAWLAVAGRR